MPTKKVYKSLDSILKKETECEDIKWVIEIPLDHSKCLLSFQANGILPFPLNIDWAKPISCSQNIFDLW